MTLLNRQDTIRQTISLLDRSEMWMDFILLNRSFQKLRHLHEVVKVTESQWDLGSVFMNSISMLCSPFKHHFKSITMTIKSKRGKRC